MYTVTSKLKIFAIVLIVIGAVLTAVGFLTVPSHEEIEHMVSNHDVEHHDGEEYIKEGQGHGDDHTTSMSHHSDEHSDDHHGEDAHHGSDTDVEHVTHQVHNRPWSAVYISAFFFFMIGLGALVFLALQKAAQAGWSVVLFRVMEGISAYILPGGIIMFILLLLASFHVTHIFHWMDPEVIDPSNPHYDELIAGKTGFLNVPFFLARASAFLIGWNLYRWNIRKFGLKQDEDPKGNVWYKKGFKHSAMFLVFFLVTESIMSWDWIMSFDPHWFSTLFGWYILAGMMVSAITTIALVTIFLKNNGYLEYVNDSHIHDLAKFMFGFSVFWTYLWFSQFMLIWYSNIPEEVTYFVTRIEDYNLVFFGMVAINFLLPVLILMNSDFKRKNWFVVTAGLFIIIGHYLDIYMVVMPATVGKSWFIGFPEIGAFLLFAGIFILTVFTSLSKAPLSVKQDPFLGESKHFHY
ncbi:MAG: quinol:cytochrome C oxidoreductase [Nonlabens sp.]